MMNADARRAGRNVIGAAIGTIEVRTFGHQRHVGTTCHPTSPPLNRTRGIFAEAALAQEGRTRHNALFAFRQRA
jgi:hypothetical protein